MQSKLRAIQVRQAKEPGKYFDGDGLVLIITKSGAKKWVYRYQIGGTRREMGLGTADDVSLADARDAKRKAKELIRAGVDPIDQREQDRRAEEARKAEAARQAEESNPTFKWCALEYIKRHAQGWSNPKHVAQWESTLKTYAFPVVGKWCARAREELTPQERAKIDFAMAESRRLRDEDRRQRRQAAADKASALLAAATPATDDHPYLQRKGVNAGSKPVRAAGEGCPAHPGLLAEVERQDAARAATDRAGRHR